MIVESSPLKVDAAYLSLPMRRFRFNGKYKSRLDFFAASCYAASSKDIFSPARVEIPITKTPTHHGSDCSINTSTSILRITERGDSKEVKRSQRLAPPAPQQSCAEYFDLSPPRTVIGQRSCADSFFTEASSSSNSVPGSFSGKQATQQNPYHDMPSIDGSVGCPYILLGKFPDSYIAQVEFNCSPNRFSTPSDSIERGCAPLGRERHPVLGASSCAAQSYSEAMFRRRAGLTRRCLVAGELHTSSHFLTKGNLDVVRAVSTSALSYT